MIEGEVSVHNGAAQKKIQTSTQDEFHGHHVLYLDSLAACANPKSVPNGELGPGSFLQAAEIDYWKRTVTASASFPVVVRRYMADKSNLREEGLIWLAILRQGLAAGIPVTFTVGSREQ